MTNATQPSCAVVLGSFVQACCWQVPHLPSAGETLAASAVSVEAGGKGLNVAIGLQRLGMAVDIVLGVGRDAAAASLHTLLQQEKVGARHVHGLAEMSGYGSGWIAADGRNAIAVYPGPNALVAAEHIQAAESEIARANIVYGQLEMALAANLEAFRLARQHGVRTVLNPSPWQTLPTALAELTDIFLVNEVEVVGLLSLEEPLPANLAAIQTLLAEQLPAFWQNWRGEWLVVTLGALGSLAYARDSLTPLVGAPYAIQAVDTVGAGDAFACGFVWALHHTSDVAQALQIGNACGADMAAHWGVLGALPSPATLAKYGCAPAGT